MAHLVAPRLIFAAHWGSRTRPGAPRHQAAPPAPAFSCDTRPLSVHPQSSQRVEPPHPGAGFKTVGALRDSILPSTVFIVDHLGFSQAPAARLSAISALHGFISEGEQIMVLWQIAWTLKLGFWAVSRTSAAGQLLHGASSEAAAGKTILVAHPTAESTTVNASGVNTIGSSVAMKRPITSLDEVPITGLQWRQSSVS